MKKSKVKYPELRAALQSQYGIKFTSKQLEKLATDPRERHDLALDCTDTAVRETFGTLVVWDVLGKRKYWPTMGEGSDAASAFHLEFFPAAKQKGYELAPFVSDSLKQVCTARMKLLRKRIIETQAELSRLESLTF